MGVRRPASLMSSEEFAPSTGFTLPAGLALEFNQSQVSMATLIAVGSQEQNPSPVPIRVRHTSCLGHFSLPRSPVPFVSLSTGQALARRHPARHCQQKVGSACTAPVRRPHCAG